MSLVFEPPFRQRNWGNKNRKRARVGNEDDEAIRGESASSDDHIDHARGRKHIKTLPELEVSSDGQPNTSQRGSLGERQKREINLRYQHLTVLNAALYSCLQKGDYKRASRIFGILVRFEPPSQQKIGRHVDLRRKNLWGAGVEILLRRRCDRNDECQNTHEISEEVNRNGEERRPISTEEGFEDAKAFFERLILQYPTRIKSSQAMTEEMQRRAQSLHESYSATALDFYPAFLSVWIHQVEARNDRRLQRILELQQPRLVSTSEDGALEPTPPDSQGGVEELAEACVKDVNSIVQRIEEVTRVPPYYSHPKLLRMKGDVYKWMSDIVAATDGHADDTARWHQLSIEARERAHELEDEQLDT